MLVMESKDFDVMFKEGDDFSIDFTESPSMIVDMGPAIEREYHGSYEVAPTTDYQTLHTTNRVLTHEIVVDPIPQNYGLITRRGNIIIVS